LATRTLIVLIIIVLQCSLGYAQSSLPPPLSPPLIAKPVRTVGQARVYYFLSTNTSRAEVDFYLLGQPPEDYLMEDYPKEDVLAVRVEFEVSGKSLLKPQEVSLSIRSYSRSKGFKYKNNLRLTILADDVSILSGNLWPIFQIRETRGRVIEHYGAMINYEVFRQMINAGRVKIIFGGTEIELQSDHRKALQDLNRTIEN
jgi:hypothetical protein